jgi:hypothetical protein
LDAKLTLGMIAGHHNEYLAQSFYSIPANTAEWEPFFSTLKQFIIEDPVQCPRVIYYSYDKRTVGMIAS